MTITITDSEDQVVFSDTVVIEAEIDQFPGIKLDTEVYHDRSYKFDVDIPNSDGASTETVVDCGNVYIVTDKGN